MPVSVCLCLPFYVLEPTPWISGVGRGRDEQSWIKNIPILVRQEPPFLLGDSAIQGKENNPSFYFLYFCHLLCLTVLRPPALSASSVHCVSLSLFLLYFYHCPVLCCPPCRPPSPTLSSSSSLLLSSLFLGLCAAVKSCWQRVMADGPLLSPRQFWDSGGFL